MDTSHLKVWTPLQERLLGAVRRFLGRESCCVFAPICTSFQTVAFAGTVLLIQLFFFRYFTLFMNLLNDCSEVEDESAQTGGRKRGMSRRLASLRHCTVLAMSNLLNANVDSGLMHSIGKVVRDHCV